MISFEDEKNKQILNCLQRVVKDILNKQKELHVEGFASFSTESFSEKPIAVLDFEKHVLEVRQKRERKRKYIKRG